MSTKVIIMVLALIGVFSAVTESEPNVPGDLDTTFGSGGIVSEDFGGLDVASAIALQNDGKILVGGGNESYAGRLIRYHANGTLDTSFGQSGVVSTTVGAWYPFSSILLTDDGKILVGGRSGNGNDTDFAILRYNSDGSLDTSFDGDGIRHDDVSSGQDDWIRGMALQADGKIVAVGEGNGMIWARYNNDGTRDTTFGTNGIVTLPGSWITDVAIQSDGKIVSSGYSASSFTIVRLNSNGSFDGTFDGDGIVYTDFGGLGQDVSYGLTLQDDGKIVAVGSSLRATPFDYDMVIARYHSNGALDTTFGSGGKIVQDFDNGLDEAFDVVVKPAGKIVVVGYGPGIVVMQFQSDGSFDSDFADQGIFSGVGSRGHAIVVQPDLKLVATGYSSNNFITIRLEGEPDNTTTWELFLPFLSK